MERQPRPSRAVATRARPEPVPDQAPDSTPKPDARTSQTGEPVTTIYKIFRADEWAGAQRAGRFTGSADDRRDGFIHFSTAGQLEGTAAKHFAGEAGLVLAEVDAAALGPDLRWEPSRGGQLFPHLYGDLPLAAVTRTWPLPLAEGAHVFPEGLKS